MSYNLVPVKKTYIFFLFACCFSVMFDDEGRGAMVNCCLIEMKSNQRQKSGV